MEPIAAETSHRELTFGEKLVGVNFNPSKDPRVDKIKALAAEMADVMKTFDEEKVTKSYLHNSFLGSATRRILDAQMWCVKALTNTF